MTLVRLKTGTNSDIKVHTHTHTAISLYNPSQAWLDVFFMNMEFIREETPDNHNSSNYFVSITVRGVHPQRRTVLVYSCMV